MKHTLENYFKDIPIDDHTISEDNIFLHHELFTNMINDAVCIIDFQNRNFHDVSDHNFFLCGYSRNEAKSLGYQFFNEIIYPDDIPLWVEMHNAILKYLYEQKFVEEEIHYFSCTFRIKSSFQFRKTPYYLMSEVRLRPVFINNELKYGICLFTDSTIKTSGNLCVYFKEKKNYREYSFRTKKWINKNMLKLSLREKEIIILTQQGLNRNETADKLCVSDKTVRNNITRILKKSNAKKMIEVINTAKTHRLIYRDIAKKPNNSK